MVSAGNPAQHRELREPKTEGLVRVINARVAHAPRKILVVGCGSGLEAAVLAQAFGADTTGIDLHTNFDEVAARYATLKRGDATSIDAPDETFDLVFSYHALEHIPAYEAALAEMRRVLRPHGSYLIGTPNRSRLLGYLGSKEASLRQKVWWNAIDWGQRLRGRFRNELGAHAGFSANELKRALENVFSTADDVSPSYYREIYPHRQKAISLLLHSRLAGVSFPSVYFFGRR